MRFGQGSAPVARSRALAALAGLGALSLAALTPAPAPAQIPAAPPDAQTQARAQAAASDRNLTAQVPKSLPIPMPSLAPLVQHVSSAVVTISAQGSVDKAARTEDDSDDDARPGGLPFEDFLRRFFDKDKRGMPETGREFVGLGSGFIVDPQGYVVTNNHVVSKAEKITVILQDNTRHEAKVIGRDEKTDL